MMPSLLLKLFPLRSTELLATCRDGNSHKLTPAALTACIGPLSTALQGPPPSPGLAVRSGLDDVLTACGPIDEAAPKWLHQVGQDGGASMRPGRESPGRVDL